MTTVLAEISRRKFLAAGGIAAATACLAPTALFAQSDDALVPGALKEAATAKITIQALRRNIEDHALHANSTTLILKHYSPAHTDSDISVHFVEADVFHTGDTFWNGYYPFIDYSTGGSIGGMIQLSPDYTDQETKVATT